MRVELEKMLQLKGMTKYRLSMISGVPKTTILDICSGRTSLKNCRAETVFLLAQALGCSMETLLLASDSEGYDEGGLPVDKSYLECGLPNYLIESIKEMQASWDIVDAGGKDLHWDCYWSNLSADINSAEVEQIITSTQANYLREKYLRVSMEK
jgi:transcriptional regulator with XRE-family HTH domain